jgi:SAM-dependent methyltransferase
MLEQGRQLATAGGLRNIAFLLGDAVALPWIDGQFDLVTCRLTLHQVADPAAVVQEMLRVTRPGGRVAVIDLTAPDDAREAAEMNRLEKLRDPSHGRTLSERETHNLMTATGAAVVHCSRHDQPLDVEDWMERTATPAATRALIRARFAQELVGAPPTGLRPSRDAAGVLHLTHTWTMSVAQVGSPA